VVIHDLYIMGVAAPPSETDPPLVVDPDAVLPLPISPQPLESVPGRDPQVVQPLGGIKHPELPQGHPLHIRSKPPDGVPREQLLGIPISEALDHGT
jgi:hypothetical protein